VKVPTDHDDEILDDYEELPDEAHGGPVDKPSGRPSERMGPPSKGKISAQSAKRIWFLCIGISVLAIAAVVVDYVWDPLGRRPVVDNPGQANTPLPPPRKDKREPSEHEKLATAFMFGTNEKHKKMRESRAYDIVRLAINETRKAGDAAVADAGNGDLWLEAWLKYYDARYKLELFRFRWPHENATTPLVGALDDRQAMLDLTDDELKSEQGQSYLASKLHYDKMYGELSDFENKWSALAKASSVKNDNEEVKAARAKFEAARDNAEFTDEDKEKANQEPRGPDEPPPYLE
jgi:hypothetical protein